MKEKSAKEHEKAAQDKPQTSPARLEEEEEGR